MAGLSPEDEELVRHLAPRLLEYRRDEGRLPPALVPLAHELGLLARLAAGTYLCRLASLHDLGAAAGAAPVAQGRLGATDCLRRRFEMRALLLGASEHVPSEAPLGRWTFCAGEVAPHLHHHPAAACERDGQKENAPRPRLPSLLPPKRAKTAEEREEAQELWTVELLAEESPGRLRQLRAGQAALSADASKMAKCWAFNFLSPHLEAPAQVPHLGPHQTERQPLGR